MVLQELGRKINEAFEKFSKQDIVNEEEAITCLKNICNALLQADVNVFQIKKLRDRAIEQVKIQGSDGVDLRNLVKGIVIQELIKLLKSERQQYQPKKSKSNVILFVGLQGNGKTTTCGKYANYYKKLNWRPALIGADTFRAGAIDQLSQIAKKIRVPFYGSYEETDPVIIARDGVNEFKKLGQNLIIVDSSGRHKQEGELFVEMQQMVEAIKPDEIIFVMDGCIGQACYNQAIAFKEVVDVGSVIVTKLDGHAKGGGALSAVAATGSPITFIGTGEHMDDFVEFDAENFVNRLLGIKNMKMILDLANKLITNDEQKEIITDIFHSTFTLRSLQTQYKSALRMGSFTDFMQYMPGVNNSKGMSDAAQQQGLNRLKQSLVALDSMTNDELDCKVSLCQVRMKRIAKGSGTSVRFIKQMLEQYQTLKDMTNKFVGKRGGRGFNPSTLLRNPNMLEQSLKGMNPQMLQQFGGISGMKNMIQNMGNMTNNGNMDQSSVFSNMLQSAKKGKY